MKQIPFYNTRLEEGFWAEKQKTSRNVTVDAVYDRFEETHRFEAMKCDREQHEREGWKPHIFWDSDAAKWIEGAAFTLEYEKNEELENKIDRLVDMMCNSQLEDGYYNAYFNVYETDKRFTVRDNHELYCLGHLIEAAIAYYHATKKDKLLHMVERYVDFVIKTFVCEKSAGFVTPGHEEIELALVKLYRLTGEEKYLELSKFFIDNRGNNDFDIAGHRDWMTAHYPQDHLPVREQTTAEGHSVRAMYLYMAMADLALECKDEALFNACDKIFHNVAEKRMYITGGIGSSHIGEAFTVDYDLKNEEAYTETCATLALSLFCQRMSRIKPLGLYGDIAELAMYNGSISGVSIKGDEFFYENPLTIDLADHDKNHATQSKERYPITQRVKVFDCSCCPPNILRYINSIGDFLYTEDDDTLFVHHYMNSSTEFENKKISQQTNYPSCGKVKLTVMGDYKKIAVRVPSWCKNFDASAPYDVKDGYAYFDMAEIITFDFNIAPRFVVSAPGVHENAGKTALMLGPVVYCVEGVDNEGDIFGLSVNKATSFDLKQDGYFGLPVITVEGCALIDNGNLYSDMDSVKYQERKIKFIPYYGMENRGETDMLVWVPLKV